MKFSFGHTLLLAGLCLLIPLGNVNAFQKPTHTVTFCADPDWLPYEAIQNGKHVGIAADYLNIIANHAKVRFKLKPTTNWHESMKFVRNGQCDAISMLNYSESRAEFLAFTQAYFTSGNVMVSRNDMPFLQDLSLASVYKVGVVSGYRLTEYIHKYHPDITTVEVHSELAGLHALQSKKIDLFLGSMLSINAHIQRNSLSDLKVAGWVGPQDQLRIGVNRDNQWLIPLLNKAIEEITEQEHLNIYRNWVNTKIVHRTNTVLAWQVGAIALVIIMLLMVRYGYISKYNKILSLKNQELSELKSQLEMKNKELSYLTVHDPLTKLHNRHFFDHRITQEIKRAQRAQHPICLMLIDLDLFKHINDEHGHSVGDIVLCQFADILKASVRDIDLLARWGGEEFSILCPETNLYESELLAERLAGKIANFEFSNHLKITCSIGIAQYQDDESAGVWFDRADKALYEAKSDGRNRIKLAATKRSN